MIFEGNVEQIDPRDHQVLHSFVKGQGGEDFRVTSQGRLQVLGRHPRTNVRTWWTLDKNARRAANRIKSGAVKDLADFRPRRRFA